MNSESGAASLAGMAKGGVLFNYCFWRDKRGNNIALEKVAT